MRGILIELSLQEEAALLRITDGGSGVDDLDEDDLNRLQTHALIEQRGISFGLTTTGIQTVARLRSR
jgi:hypothetical protein